MRRVVVAGVALLLVVTGASAATGADPGVTPTKVVLGGTVPLSGEAAAFGSVGPGAKAYFAYVNAKGGVNGRTIDYRYLDDGYDPAQTVKLTRQLVEQDRVFAIFNSVGTGNNLAIRPYLAAQKVPQLFAGDGSDALAQPSKYPGTMGLLPSYRGEGAVYGRTLVKTRPGAKIGILFENTELGKDMTRGLSRTIAGKGPRIVASEPYDYTSPDVSSQIAKLKASGANTLVLFATPKFMIQGIVAAHKLGWKPSTVVIASVSIEPGIMGIARTNAPELTKGALSIAFLKNPNDPVWFRDPARALYLKILKKYAPGAKPTDVYNWYGMTAAWTMVETLRQAGRNLTRTGLVRAAQHLDLKRNPFLLPGLTIRTSPSNYFPIADVYLYRYDNAQWVRASPLQPAR